MLSGSNEEAAQGHTGNGMMRLGREAPCPGSPAWVVACSTILGERGLGVQGRAVGLQEVLETGSKSLTLTSASWNLDCPPTL